jgi:ABC-2 type transport system permease protein
MKFLAIARMAFFRESFYRFELVFNALRAVLFVLVISAVWRAVYTSRPVVAGFSLDAVILYTCIAAALTLVFETNLEREIGDRLRSGNLAVQLLKPINYFGYGLAEGAGTVAYTALFSAVPTFIALAFFFDFPSSTLSAAVGALAMTGLGFVLFFSFCHLTALTTFFTEEGWALEYFRTTTVRFFAGGFLPLAFFPDVLEAVALWLPFPYMIYYPTLALSGRLTEAGMSSALGVQLLWCAALLLTNYAYWKLIVRRVFIHGG